MKLSIFILATVLVGGGAASILSKNHAPKGLAVGQSSKASRKLSLFTRTKEVSKAEMYGDKQPCFGSIAGSIIPCGSNEGPYPIAASNLATYGPPPPQSDNRGGPDCHPKCTWSCGNADCDEVCDPVCAPPQCETACAPINLAACRQRCEPPKCAIVCPTSHCTHGGCPGCKTVCAPPKCTTECAEQCESKCSDPQCTWKCNPGKCEKPRCSLQCGGAQCGLDSNLNARPPPFGAGMTVLAKGLAAVDPRTLSAFAAKGPSPGAKNIASPGAKTPSPKGKIR